MRKKSIFLVLPVAVLVVLFSLCLLFGRARAFSASERRKLSQRPIFTAASLLDGSFAADCESWSLDQFPLREYFRTLKAYVQYKVLHLQDNNGIYIVDGQAAKLLYPNNTASLQNAADAIQELYDLYIADANARAFLSIVPDKGFYLAEANGYPSLDYAAMQASLAAELPQIAYVDITDTLSSDAYYATDTHWRQELLIPTAQKLAAALGVAIPQESDFAREVADVPFYGVYCGQSALPLSADTIAFMNNSLIAAAQVYNLEKDTTGQVYSTAALTGKDPYEAFLSGAAALLVIDNPVAENDRELIVFRDSFASALVPLLLQDYAKITLVDTRYMLPSLVGEYVDFENNDILFLYSTLLLNDSFVLK